MNSQSYTMFTGHTRINIAGFQEGFQMVIALGQIDGPDKLGIIKGDLYIRLTLTKILISGWGPHLHSTSFAQHAGLAPPHLLG